MASELEIIIMAILHVRVLGPLGEEFKNLQFRASGVILLGSYQRTRIAGRLPSMVLAAPWLPACWMPHSMLEASTYHSTQPFVLQELENPEGKAGRGPLEKDSSPIFQSLLYSSGHKKCVAPCSCKPRMKQDH